MITAIEETQRAPLAAIPLPSGLVAKIALFPMPKAGKEGQYKLNSYPEIQVDFYRADVLIERCGLNSLITARQQVTLADGVSVCQDDLNELDWVGWRQLEKFGMGPTVFEP